MQDWAIKLFVLVNTVADSEQSHYNLLQWRRERGGDHIGKRYFICLFHFSEHVDHLQPVKNKE